MKVKVLECPRCGAPIELSAQACEYCEAPIFVTRFRELKQFDPEQLQEYIEHYKTLIERNPYSSEGVLSLGLCYLEMRTYPLAQKSFEQVIEASPLGSSAYYFCALATIRERRLMTLSLREARQLEMYLNAAWQLDTEAPQYRLLLAMLKRDFYEKNGLKVTPPNAAELLSDLAGETIDEDEVDHLRRYVKVSEPEDYFSHLHIA